MRVNRLLLTTLLNYFNVVSKDVTRPQLECVHLVIKDNVATLEATNGYVAITSKHIVEDNGQECNILIKSNSLKTLSVFLSEHKSENMFSIEIDLENNFLKILVNHYSIILNLLNRDFPNLLTVMPSLRNEEVNNFIIINPDLIYILRLAVYGKSKVNIIKFNFQLPKSKDAPIRIDHEYLEINHTMLLMPIRGNK